MNASRTRTDGCLRATVGDSGERVSNTWVTCLSHRDSSGKLELIPNNAAAPHGDVVKALVAPIDGLASD